MAGVYSLHVYQVISNLNLARRSVLAFTELASFYSKGFPLGTLYENRSICILELQTKNIKVRRVCRSAIAA